MKGNDERQNYCMYYIIVQKEKEKIPKKSKMFF